MQKTDPATWEDSSLSSRHPLRCLFCDEPEQAKLFEIWGHEFMIQTCCEGLHEQIVFDMNADPAWGRELLRRLEIEPLTGHRLRRVTDDGCAGLVLDWQLQLGPVSSGQARRFIAQHHAHCGIPTAWRFHGAVFNGRTLMGVAIVGNPVARAYSGRGIVEINRLCIRRDTPTALRWNAASMLYGWCAREAERRGWHKIITYTRADEPGTSLDAAGWHRDASIRGRGWHSAKRPRSNRNGWIDKVRWSRPLSPRPQPDPLPERNPAQCAASTLTGWTTAASVFGFARG
ncbi:MAG: hypothetical protein HIU92_20125 [Proteobacteria bacterium]|nr:hypothetical protein [Pseudomonadota bacterium]